MPGPVCFYTATFIVQVLRAAAYNELAGSDWIIAGSVIVVSLPLVSLSPSPLVNRHHILPRPRRDHYSITLDFHRLPTLFSFTPLQVDHSPLSTSSSPLASPPLSIIERIPQLESFSRFHCLDKSTLPQPPPLPYRHSQHN